MLARCAWLAALVRPDRHVRVLTSSRWPTSILGDGSEFHSRICSDATLYCRADQLERLAALHDVVDRLTRRNGRRERPLPFVFIGYRESPAAGAVMSESTLSRREPFARRDAERTHLDRARE